MAVGTWCLVHRHTHGAQAMKRACESAAHAAGRSCGLKSTHEAEGRGAPHLPWWEALAAQGKNVGYLTN